MVGDGNAPRQKYLAVCCDSHIRFFTKLNCDMTVTTHLQKALCQSDALFAFTILSLVYIDHLCQPGVTHSDLWKEQVRESFIIIKTSLENIEEEKEVSHE